MNISIQELILNATPENWIKDFAPLIVGIITAILGVVAAFVPYLTEKGRIRKQISIQREIDDLVDFKAALHAYYFKVIEYYRKIENEEERIKVHNSIQQLSSAFRTKICLVSHYFNDDEIKKIECFTNDFVFQELNAYSTIRGESKALNENSKRTERLFKEIINIISNKIKNG